MKERYTRKDDYKLLRLCSRPGLFSKGIGRGKVPLKDVADLLGRTVPSIKARLRALRHMVQNFKSIKAYHDRRDKRDKLYVSPTIWTEQADRELIKKGNKGYSLDRRGQRRIRVLKNSEEKLTVVNDKDKWANRLQVSVDDLMKFVHQRTVPSKLYLEVLGSLKKISKECDGLSDVKKAIAKLAA